MTKKPALAFSRVWYAQAVLVAVAALPLELLGWEAWPFYMSYVVVFGLGWFGSSEWAAEVVDETPERDSGTMTSWLFWKVDGPWGRVGRVLYGIVIGLVLWWRLPDIWYLDEVVAFYFITWLPYHYWTPGIRGPWEWLGGLLEKPFR